MNLFEVILVNPLLNVLVAFYHALFFINMPYALGFSIILVTVIIKIILHPLTVIQLKAAKQMQELAPQINKIKEKYKGDMQRQQQETMALYKSSGFNPASGCLPALIPIPLFLGLYWALDKLVKVKSPAELNGALYFEWLRLDVLWNTTFFGIPLGKSPAELMSSYGVFILLVPVVTALLQLIQSKMMMARKAASKDKVKSDKPDDFATVFQKQSLFLLPLFIGYVTYTFPFGLSLYWNTFTIFGIIQQYRIQGLGGLTEWLGKKK